MYFIPRNNFFYHRIAHISSFYRYLSTCMFVSIIIIAWLYWFYFPLEKQIGAHHDSIKQLVMQHEQQVSHLPICEDLSHSISALKTDMSTNVSMQDINEHFKVQLLYMMDTIKKTDLKLDKYIVKQEKNKSLYKKNQVQLVVSGKFENILRFLDMIRLSQKLITIGSFSLSSLDSDVFIFRCDVDFVFVT